MYILHLKNTLQIVYNKFTSSNDGLTVGGFKKIIKHVCNQWECLVDRVVKKRERVTVCLLLVTNNHTIYSSLNPLCILVLHLFGCFYITTFAPLQREPTPVPWCLVLQWVAVQTCQPAMLWEKVGWMQHRTKNIEITAGSPMSPVQCVSCENSTKSPTTNHSHAASSNL